MSPGKLCPLRHDHGGKVVVCKHWLRGLCKKGDQCKFLHQYDVARMPECYFYSKFGKCLSLAPALQPRGREGVLWDAKLREGPFPHSPPSPKPASRVPGGRPGPSQL